MLARPRPTQFPIDYSLIRKTLVNVIQTKTLQPCIVEEATYVNAPRPELPYYSFKITSAAIKSGDDFPTETVDGVTNMGGVRKMMISFHCYACSKDDAYSFMSLMQSSFDLESVRETLRRAGIAVWVIGNVADLSQLLNTGFEGRTQMDVSFGVASNLGDVLGSIDSVGISGSVDTDNGSVTTSGTVTAP